MEKENVVLIFAIIACVIVVSCIIIGTYLISKDKPVDPCENITGCDKYKCLADNEPMINRANYYLLQEQNCLLKNMTK